MGGHLWVKHDLFSILCQESGFAGGLVRRQNNEVKSKEGIMVQPFLPIIYLYLLGTDFLFVPD